MDQKVDNMMAASSSAEDADLASTTPSAKDDISRQQTSYVDRVLEWPVIQRLLQYETINLSQRDGKYKSSQQWLIEISHDFDAFMPFDSPESLNYEENGILDLQGQSLHLNKDYVEQLCAAYFMSFHCSYPVLDRAHICRETVPEVCRQSFGDLASRSVLVLLILALGELAREGAKGDPISDDTGRSTGVRGGTVNRPPGLLYMNEARRRFGISLTQWDTTTLQCCILFW
jgi:hypothetical protein